MNLPNSTFKGISAPGAGIQEARTLLRTPPEYIDIDLSTLTIALDGNGNPTTSAYKDLNISGNVLYVDSYSSTQQSNNGITIFLEANFPETPARTPMAVKPGFYISQPFVNVRLRLETLAGIPASGILRVIYGTDIQFQPGVVSIGNAPLTEYLGVSPQGPIVRASAAMTANTAVQLLAPDLSGTYPGYKGIIITSLFADIQTVAGGPDYAFFYGGASAAANSINDANYAEVGTFKCQTSGGVNAGAFQISNPVYLRKGQGLFLMCTQASAANLVRGGYRVVY